jgi:hypothetical protein
MPIGGDGEFTARGIYYCGAVFFPAIICEFMLGGVSTSYSRVHVVLRRLKETTSPIQQLKLLTKLVLWRLLPRRLFYDLMGSYKYTRFTDAAALSLPTSELHISPYADAIGSNWKLGVIAGSPSGASEDSRVSTEQRARKIP